MTAFQAALLGIVQGLTEFLPISSSAHLVLTRALFGWAPGELALAFDVACHVGTLLAVLVYFRQDVWRMTVSMPHIFARGRGTADSGVRLVRQIAIGTLPIVVVGLLFADAIQSTLRTPIVAAAALALGALVMAAAERVGSRVRTEETLTGREALYLGFAQAAALVPGVSRSGAVLTIAMLFGLRRERAARFAFLLGIPAIVAAAGREAVELASVGVPPGALGLFAVGMLSSAVVGYATVKYFIRFLADNSLYSFVAYRVVIAALIVFALRGA